MTALTTSDSRAAIIPRAQHNISRADISPAALKVLYRLKDAGFQAFLVGGAVRDLLLGHHPKDFDIATDAHPEEVRRVFRNCRLIGRRFRLAHVHFGDEIIEVATFRAPSAPDEVDDEDHREIDDNRVQDDSGRLLRDNVYGDINGDVWRRDFTANSLYYNIADFSIWDYTGGVADVRERVLRLIGDPETRYREDPVRMLRAARFAAKLGFSVDADTLLPMRELAELLDGVPSARLFDECSKLFLSGHAIASLDRLRAFGLLGHLLPQTAAELIKDPEGPAARLLQLGLEGTDERVRADRSVTPTFLYAVLLYGPIQRGLLQRMDAGMPEHIALGEAIDACLQALVRRVAVPKRFTLPLRELLLLQPRFDRRDGRRALGLLGHPRFRAAYDFMLLRADAGLVSREVAEWWTEIQTLDHDGRAAMAAAAPPLASTSSAEGQLLEQDADSDGGGDRPRRRRRRRRGRGGGGGGHGDG